MIRTLLVPASLLLTACLGKRDPVEVHYYLPTLGSDVATDERRVHDLALAIERLSTAPHLHGDRLTARISPTEIEYYVSHRWPAPLDDVVTMELYRALRPAFRAVVRDPARADCVLGGTIERFEEVDEGDSWFAHVGLHLTLTDPEGDPLLDRYFERRTRAETRHPAAVVEALRTGLAEIVAELESELASLP
jgi:uncharacterized lipoprotein YmbA